MSASSISQDNMVFAEGHWSVLAVLLRQMPSMAETIMRRPAPPALPDGDLLECLAFAAAEADREELLAKHLLSGLLPATGGDHQDLRRNLAKRHLPGISPQVLSRCAWIHVPILVVQGGSSRVVWMLVGRRPGNGDCRFAGLPEPDGATAGVIRAALRLQGRGHDYFCWFLQCADEQPVSGDSLGLPVALAGHLLERSRPWPRDVYATGALEPDGRIRAVGSVLEKLRTVITECRLFLRPGRCDLAGPVHGVEHGCDTVAEATYVLDLFTSGISASELVVCEACSREPQLLLSRFHALPLPTLRTTQCRRTLREAAADTGHFLEDLVRTLRRCGHDRERGGQLAALFTADEILRIARLDSRLAFAAFDWCLACIAFYNHQGDTAESAAWTGTATRLRPYVEDSELARFVNHAFVARRFNRYDFRPDPPEQFRKCLDVEENIHAQTGRSSALLGAMYGTMAQNYGFCGPKFLKFLIMMADKAEAAFGRRYRSEARRLLNYRIYGLLDSGGFDEACALVPSYLGLASATSPGEWFREAENLLSSPEEDAPFRVALVLRLLADTGFRPAGGRGGRTVPDILQHTSHPWQLIALNLGKILAATGHPEEAEELFRHGLRICGAKGITMRPMGLLFLAELDGMGWARDDDRAQALELVRWISEESSLKREHFSALFVISKPEVLLGTVQKRARSLFPFSYR